MYRSDIYIYIYIHTYIHTCIYLPINQIYLFSGAHPNKPKNILSSAIYAMFYNSISYIAYYT